MLGQEYFDGTKHKQLDDIISQYNNIMKMAQSIKKKEQKYLFEDEDLLVFKEVIENIKDCNYDVQVGFLAFCKRSLMRHRGFDDMFEISYPVIDGASIDITRIYYLPGYKMRAFCFTQMYTLSADEELFCSMVSNAVDVSVDVLASRNNFEDGQLKIVLETILTIDDMVVKEGCSDKSVLVIGSSSEGGVASGYAYEALPLMLRNSDVDLYDIHNNEGKVSINGVCMNYFKKNKVVSKDDPYKYNLILDDAWEDPMKRTWDRNCLSFKFPHFSIKWFEHNPDMPQLPGGLQKYYQVFKTGVAECRIVSRLANDFNYRNIPLLGNCPGCRELKFRLRGSYDDSLYKWFMMCHKVHCIDHSIVRNVVQPLIEGKNDRYQTWYRIHSQSDFSRHKVMYYNNFDGRYRIIPVNQVFEEDRLIFNDFSYVTYELFVKCFIVVLIGREAYINVSDLVGYLYDGQKITVMKSCIVRGFRERRFLLNRKLGYGKKDKLDVSNDSLWDDDVQEEESVITYTSENIPGSVELDELLSYPVVDTDQLNDLDYPT